MFAALGAARFWVNLLQIIGINILLSGDNAVGNEPHHVGLSRDGRTVALGGLLSALKGQDQVFFFDVSEPRHPTFIPT
jgi:hypothetical protein